MTGAALDATVHIVRGSYVLDVHVQADAGEIVAVMGPSGVGKSTLFGAIAGFVPLTGGQVRLDGQTVDAATGPYVRPHERGVVMLGQEPRLFPHLTARENVAFGPRAHGVARRTARADADAWLSRVGLAGMGERRPAQLSGGQQQRVALARALATAPRVLLLDEPLTSLDAATAAEIRALLREQLADTGTTALVATHDAQDAASLATRLIVLEGGAIAQAGPVHAVLGNPATPFVAAVAATLPSADRPHGAHGWQARVTAAADDGTVRALGPDGAEIVLRLPAGAGVVPGSVVTVRAPRA
ncbi:ABC transporter ATP-binding protein [Microbacterium luticocti]|uniref:ABC transporter ATP-binding protein n=1 Tax=Microbacterium luticocti TaxID=451764 RepID=UPI000411E0CD|nr:ATP-binding cassette domain-containing protein [Microbacterium luticocti]